MKILGVIFDRDFTFTEHLNKLHSKAKVRLALVSRVASQSWGLEVGMLRLTGEALVISLLRYCFAVVGSGLPECLFRRIDTQLINPLARKVAGVGPSARIPVLHAVAGHTSAHNLFVQHCGELLNLSLRANNSSIRERLYRWVCRAYRVESWVPVVEEIPQTDMEALHPLIGRLRYLDFDIAESWMVQVLPKKPSLLERLHTPSVYYTGASEIRSKPNLRALTYDFVGSHSWNETGIQILSASGWRPDCTLQSSLNVERTLPPLGKSSAIYCEPYGMATTAASLHIEETGYSHWINGTGKGIRITVGAFFQEGFGISSAWFTDPNGMPTSQTWILGEDPYSSEPPSFILEASLCHALHLTERLYLQQHTTPDFIAIKAGNWKTNRALYRWFIEGQLRLNSDAADEIARAILRLSKTLACPLIISGVPGDFFSDLSKKEGAEAMVIATAVSRVTEHAIPRIRKEWGQSIARIPWTTDELKHQMKKRYQIDERRTIAMLEEQGSHSSIIFANLQLTRGIIKGSLKKLQTNRRRQTVLAGILCATRFKYFTEKGELLEVNCPNNCGHADSLQHMLECYNLHPPVGEEDPDAWMRFLITMVRKVERNSPFIPLPIVHTQQMEEEGDEISLGVTESRSPPSPPLSPLSASSLGVSLVDSGDHLSFDGNI